MQTMRKLNNHITDFAGAKQMLFIRRSAFCTVVVSALLASNQSAHAVVRNWDGGGVGGTDLGVAANWNPDGTPSVSVPDTAQFNGTVLGPLSLVHQNNVFAGVAGNAGMLLDITASQTDSLTIDAATGAGSIRLNNTAITIAAGAGAVTFGDGIGPAAEPALTFTMGGAANTTQSMTNNSANTATFNSEVVFNNGGGGNHVYLFTGTGNWTVNNPITNAGGRVTVAKSGSGTLTLSGANTFGGPDNADNTVVSAGFLNLNGTLTTGVGGGSRVIVSGAAEVPVLNVNNSITSSNGNNASILIANSAANTLGVVNHTAGTVSLTGSMIMGASGTTNYGFHNKTGGTYTQTGNNRFRIGQGGGAGSAMLYYHSGGTATISVGIALNDTAGATAGTGGAAVLYVTGGSMTSTVGTLGLGIGGRQGQAEVTIAGTGTVNLIGATSLGGSVAGAPAAGDAGRVAVLNLGNGTAGGTLNTAQVLQDGNAATLGYLNFNGGTLKAQTVNAGFLQGLTQTTVHAAGGTIDNTGFAITINQNLLAPTGDGVTSIAVSGATGYRGAPYVQISGGGATTPATAVANIDGSGNVTSITITNPGTGYTSAPTVTLVGGGGTAGTITPTVSAISGGGMTFEGGGATTLTGTNTYSGTTNVNAGTLLVNGSNTGAGAVNVNGATLGGTGSIAGPVNVNNFGLLSPGTSIESLGTGALSFGAGSAFSYELNSTALTADLLDSTGSLSISTSGTGASLTVSDLGGSLIAAGTKFTMIGYDGTWDGGTFAGVPNFATFIAGPNTYRIRYNDPNEGLNFANETLDNAGFVTLTVVPEASTFVIVGLGGIFVIAAVRMGKRFGFAPLEVLK